jgi:hypothetical protein
MNTLITLLIIIVWLFGFGCLLGGQNIKSYNSLSYAQKTVASIIMLILAPLGYVLLAARFINRK